MSQFGDKDIIHEAALNWYDAGCSMIPIRADGTKRPTVEWKPYMAQRATRDQVSRWFVAGLGIGIVCGEVSGNLEMLELEGRAASGEDLTAILTECHKRAVDHVFESLLSQGYAEWTPSGGLHMLYRISDHEVPGNTKVARRPATAEELAVNPKDTIKVLSETRGEGGYVIVAPTHGTVHPTGDSWSVAAGAVGVIPTITWEDRQRLVNAIYAALDQMPAEPAITRPAPSTLLPQNGSRPGDDFNTRATWEEILQPHGWRIHHQTLQETYWTRPGKQKIDGWSATTGYNNEADRLYVWSTSTPFNAETPYNKFSAYALLEHNNDFGAAARTLSGRGFGSRAVTTTNYVAGTLATSDLPPPTQTLDTTASAPQTTQIAVHDPDWRRDWMKPHIPADAFVYAEQSLRVAGDIYAHVFEDTFKYCAEKKKWYFWNERVWNVDGRERHEDGVKELLQAARLQGQQEDSPELTKWARAMGRMSSPNVCRWARSDFRISVSPEMFDANRHLITTVNGVTDLDGGVSFQPGHDPKMLLTKSMPVTYDKDATAPQWDKFLKEVLPDADTRNYLQRAIGLTLLGDAEQRALFLLHGESGTGKSQFIRVMELMFGDFAETATATTFNASSKTATITNDLNDLRGKRFVSLSELDEDERLNESLVKRLTGGDTAKSRGLYQENKSWRVEFMMWMATNHLPRLSSDDNAIWRRVKPIQFPNVIRQTGVEVTNLGEKLFAAEASGIFNWMLEGVRKYQEHGLKDLQVITDAVDAYRRDVDTVAQFVEHAVDEHLVAVGETQQLPIRTFHAMYQEWCRNNGIRWLGERRFGHRVESLGYERKKTAAANVWLGIGTGSHGVLGTFHSRE